MDDLVRLARIARQNRGHVLVGIVRLEPRRLHGEDAVCGRVRLVEGILGEGEDIVPDLLRRGALVAVAHGTVEPVVLHRLDVAVVPLLLDFLHQGDLLFCHRLADLVALAQREAGHDDGDAHDLLLVDDRAVGALEDVLQPLVVVDDLLAPLLAVDEVVDHARAQRAGTVQGDDGDDVVVGIGFHALEQCAHTRRLDLEHAVGAACLHELEDAFVGFPVGLLEVEVDAVVVLDVAQRLRDDRQRAQAEEVHLEQAHVGGHVTVVLGDDDAAFGIELDGDVVGDGITADDDS